MKNKMFCGDIETVCICQTSKKKKIGRGKKIDVHMLTSFGCLRNFLVYLFSVAVEYRVRTSSNSIVKMLIHC